jgi:hypothetical protein
VQFFPGTFVVVHSLCVFKLQQFSSSHQLPQLSLFHLQLVSEAHDKESLNIQQFAAEACTIPNITIKTLARINTFKFILPLLIQNSYTGIL